MKRRWPILLESAALSMLCAWGAVGCLLSGFSLAVAAPNRVVLVWLLWTVIASALMPLRMGQAAVLTLGAVGAFLLRLEGSFGQQLLATLGEIAKTYDAAYGWGILRGLRTQQLNSDLPLTVLGMILIFTVSRTVCRRKDSAMAVLLLLLPLAACLLVTDTVPGEGYLFALLLGLSLLLLTDGVRREDGPQAAKLSLTAVIPLGLALGLVMYAFPRNSFVNNTEPLRQQIRGSLLELAESYMTQGPDWLPGVRKKETVELSSLPSQLLLGVPVAEVAAEQSGPVYLRLQDYDVYTGTAWESTSGRQEALVGSGGERGWVTVKALNTKGGLLPSFPEGQSFLSGGAWETDGQPEDTMSIRAAAMGPLPGEQWLSLPADTAARAKALLPINPAGGNTMENTVAAVADFVRVSAAYDRGGTEMAPGQTDFALWFLEEADRGYCIHFATAAAVLLRSAGIPARYVTGYRVDAPAGETVSVTSDDAHAWVEYYDYRTWTWNILEVTPGDVSLEPMPTVPEPTEQTQTEPQTQPLETHKAQPAQTEPGPQSQRPVQEKRRLPTLVPLAALLPLLVWVVLESERLLRIQLRRRGQNRGDNNHRSAACSRELQLLWVLLKRPVPEEVEHLTQKALFSQHTLTLEELNVFLSCQANCRRALRRAPWWKKLVYRYWYAVI